MQLWYPKRRYCNSSCEIKSIATILMVFRKWLEYRYKRLAATRGPLRSQLRARYVEVSDHALIALAILSRCGTRSRPSGNQTVLEFDQSRAKNKMLLSLLLNAFILLDKRSNIFGQKRYSVCYFIVFCTLNWLSLIHGSHVLFYSHLTFVETYRRFYAIPMYIQCVNTDDVLFQ